MYDTYARTLPGCECLKVVSWGETLRQMACLQKMGL